jgi:sugar O-acyltransferase (sialic acid O-acetyltransferase NeuD family)
MKLAFVGYGELGKQLLGFAEEILKPSEIIIFDDDAYVSNLTNAFPFQDYILEKFHEYNFIIGLGYKHLQKKKQIIDLLKEKGRKMPSIIHPTCFVSKSAKIGEAVYAYPMCNIDKNVIIEAGTLLNNSVTISHDNQIGECCYFSPSITTSGFVKIGNCSFIGTGSIISNNISIGKNTIIGIGSVLIKDLPNNYSALGNPAKYFDKKLKII